MKRKNLKKILLLSLISLGTISVNAQETNLRAESVLGVNSDYKAVTIKNGTFENYPDNGKNAPTGGSDWQTTNNKKTTYFGTNGYFRIANLNTSNLNNQLAITKSNGSFISLTNDSYSLIYQKLATNPQDVLIWSFNHAINNTLTTNQELMVSIGEEIQNKVPEANEFNVNNMINYDKTGVAGYKASTVESENNSLNNLSLTPNPNWLIEENLWFPVKGVYLVPNKQTKTLFEIRNEYLDKEQENYIDDVEIKTLFGNLKINTNKGKNQIILSGYWSNIKENENKNLEYSIIDENNKELLKGIINMSSIKNSPDFEVEIPVSDIDNNNYKIKVNHEDYKNAISELSFSLNKRVNINEELQNQVSKDDQTTKVIFIASIIAVIVSLILFTWKILSSIRERNDTYKLRKKKDNCQIVCVDTI